MKTGKAHKMYGRGKKLEKTANKSTKKKKKKKPVTVESCLMLMVSLELGLIRSRVSVESCLIRSSVFVESCLMPSVSVESGLISRVTVESCLMPRVSVESCLIMPRVNIERMCDSVHLHGLVLQALALLSDFP